MRRTVLLSIALAIVAVPASATAATITPTPGFLADNYTDDANCSLREAVRIANANSTGPEDDCGVAGMLGDDTVSLGAGTYVLTISGPEPLDANGANDLEPDTNGPGNLTIDGAGAAATTIDSNLSPTDRIISHGSGSGSVTVSDLTLTDGHALSGPGGAIFTNSDFTVERSVVTLNSVTGNFGGGISAGGTSLTVNDSVISDNSTDGSGAGVFVSSGTASIDSSVIKGNSVTGSAQDGGGMTFQGTTLTVTDTLVANNDVTEPGASTPAGGGIRVSSPTAAATIRGSTVAGNKLIGGVTPNGAGVSVAAGSLTLINSTVSGNEALTASASGAGLSMVGGTVTLAHTTFGPNPVAAGGTSAIHRFGGTVTAQGSVIDTSGAEVACNFGLTGSDDNVYTDSSCGGGGNNLAAADPMLGGLGDHGGPDAGAPGLLEPIPTHLPALGSVVIDHVPAVDCLDVPVGMLLVDQRSLLRPVDGNGNSVADCDAGSVERQPSDTPQTPVTPPPATTPTTSTPAAVPAPAKKKCKKKKGAAASKKCKRKK